MSITDLVISKKYKRTELMEIFQNNSFMRGMNKCNKTNCLVLTSDHRPGRVYEDTIFRDDYMIYTGEGLVGDQKMTYNNKTLLESNTNHLPVHLFVRFDEDYQYYGLVRLVDDPYTVIENDTNGDPRIVFKFRLKRISQEEFDYQIKDTKIATFEPTIRQTLDVVGAAIMNDNNVLIAQRKDGELRGKWEFPGGKIKKGETAPQALAREIKEELNIDVYVGDLVDSSYYEYQNFNVNLSVYLCHQVGGEIRDEEHQEVKWVEVNKLLEEDMADADIPIAEVLVDTIPLTISNELLHYDYFESKPVQENDRQLRRAIQDYEKTQTKKQRAGDKAEVAVMKYERDQLNNAGRPDLADQVDRVSTKSSDYGYDIFSFECIDGRYVESHIEVKSAKLTENYIEFFISENELKKFKEDPSYKIYCLFRSGREYKLHIVDKNHFFASEYLTPLTYRVRIRIHE